MVATRFEKVVNYKFVMQWANLITLGLRPGDAYGMKGDRPAHWCANELARVFLATPCDSILFIDSDADIDEKFVADFRDYKPGWRYDILQAFCVRRSWPPRPVWYTEKQVAMTDRVITDPDLCEPVKAVGLHSTLIRRRVFEKLLGKNDPKSHEWFYYPRGKDQSEDIAFSVDAREAGIRIGATSAVRAGHHSDMILGWETYQEYLKANHITEAANEVAVPEVV